MREKLRTVQGAGDTVANRKMALVFHDLITGYMGRWLEIMQTQRVTDRKKGLGRRGEVLGRPIMK